MATITEIYKKDIAFKDDLVATDSGDLVTIEGVSNVQDALLRRLITTKGTLVHRPNYGVGIKSFQNAINSFSVRQRLAKEIEDQFEQDSRVEDVSSVAFSTDPSNPSLVSVKVKVKLIGLGEQQLEFNPFGDI